MKRKTRILLAASLFAALASKIFAQPASVFDERISNTNSNSFKATAHTVRNDVDYSMDPRYFQDVSFGNFLTFLNVDGSGRKLDLGFTKKINNIYFGLNYNGNLWGYGKKSQSEPTTELGITTSTKKSTNTNENSFDIVFGIGNFGAKLYFDINPDTSKTTTYTTTTTGWGNNATTKTTEDISKTSSNKFTFLGSLAYSLELSPFTLKPLASFGYYGNTIKNGDETKNGAFLMNLGTDFVFGGKDKEQIAGLFYTLDAGKTKVINAGNLSTTTSNPINVLNLYYKSNFKLGSKANLGIRANLANIFVNKKTTDNNNELVKEIFNYNLYSDLAIGVRANVTSSFNIDTGIKVGLPTISHESTKPAKGKKFYTTKTNCEFPTTLSAGFDWNLGSNWTIDLSADVPLNNKDKSIFNNINLGVSYKK